VDSLRLQLETCKFLSSDDLPTLFQLLFVYSEFFSFQNLFVSFLLYHYFRDVVFSLDYDFVSEVVSSLVFLLKTDLYLVILPSRVLELSLYSYLCYLVVCYACFHSLSLTLNLLLVWVIDPRLTSVTIGPA
jgi:hypothetical protein